MANTHGRNWIRPEKRLAIYLRDNLACVYCGIGLEMKTPLTLDHLEARSESDQMNNAADNIVTCCDQCNVLKGQQDWQSWCQQIAIRTGQEWLDVLMHVRHCLNQRLPLEQARGMLAGRKWSQALEEVRQGVRIYSGV